MNKPIKDIKELIENPWSSMDIFHLTEEQKESLLSNPLVLHEYMMINKGSVWEEHSHSRGQMILVIAGKLTHVVNRKEFIQEANDILIIPANIPHPFHCSIHSSSKLFLCCLKNPRIPAHIMKALSQAKNHRI